MPPVDLPRVRVCVCVCVGESKNSRKKEEQAGQGAKDATELTSRRLQR